VLTPCLRVTGIIRAEVTIVTIGRCASFAGPFQAAISQRTGIAIFARGPGVCLHHAATTRQRVTDGIEAWSIVTTRFVANYYCPWVYHALVGKLLQIADESSVAQVTVLQADAIVVPLAIAIDRCSNAFALLTLVTHGTNFPVIAGTRNGRMLTASLRGANIIGARVVVTAYHRCPHAHSALTMVRYRTWVAIFAFGAVQCCVHAAFLPRTGILRAIIPIITRPFVHQSVAVVVEAVTILLRRHHRIAVRQALFKTDPFALAYAHFIRILARGRERQRYRFHRTGTDPSIGHALQCVDPIDGDCR